MGKRSRDANSRDTSPVQYSISHVEMILKEGTSQRLLKQSIFFPIKRCFPAAVASVYYSRPML